MSLTTKMLVNKIHTMRIYGNKCDIAKKICTNPFTLWSYVQLCKTALFSDIKVFIQIIRAFIDH